MANGIIILLVILILLLIGSVIMFAVYYRNQVNNPVCKCQEADCNCPICPLCPITPTTSGATPAGSGGAASPTPSGGDLVSCGVPGCDNSAYCSGGKVQSGFAVYEGPKAECSNPKSCVDNDTAIAAAGSKTVTSCSDVVTKDLCADRPSADGPTLGEFCPVSCGGCPGQSKIPVPPATSVLPYISPTMSTNPYNPSPTPSILPAPSGSCNTIGCDNSVFCTAGTSSPQTSGVATFEGTQAACAATGGGCMDNDALLAEKGAVTCAQIAKLKMCGNRVKLTNPEGAEGPLLQQYCPVSCGTCPIN